MPLSDIQILTWNVGCRPASIVDDLARIRMPRPDLVTLQEVRLEDPDGFGKRLVGMGLKHVHYSTHVEVPSKCYLNVIASRWPLHAVELGYSRKELPWPEALTEASVSVSGRSIVVITAHIPNGSRNGWEKIDTFQVLAHRVREAKGRPCIVTGDFNEPRYAIEEKHIVTFGQKRDRQDRFVCRGPMKLRGRTGTRTGTGAQWDAAVRWIFEKHDEHNLRLAYWEARGHGEMHVSHVSRGQERWFDHIFASTHFRVEKCIYLDELRAPGLSDHSALTARLLLTGRTSGKQTRYEALE